MMDSQAKFVFALILFFIAYTLFYLLGRRTPRRTRTYALLLVAMGAGMLAWPHVTSPLPCILGALVAVLGYGLFRGTLAARPMQHLFLAYGVMLMAWPQPLGGFVVAAGAVIGAIGLAWIEASAAPAAHSKNHH